jgi:transcriptional regulator with XRE-family HTH domain
MLCMADLLTPEEIKRLAAKRGMTMAAVCAKAKIAASTFSRWQAGETEPTLTVYRKIVEAVSEPAAT